jgi:hypothetical protein
MRRTARKANGAIRSGKPAHNGDGPHRTTALRLNDRAAGSRMIGAQLHQGFAQIRVDWNNSAAAFLGHAIPQLQGGRDLTGWIDHHVPSQVGDFGSTQASLQRQQHNHLVADRVSGLLSDEQQVFDVTLSENFCALANHAMRSLKLELNVLYGSWPKLQWEFAMVAET